MSKPSVVSRARGTATSQRNFARYAYQTSRSVLAAFLAILCLVLAPSISSAADIYVPDDYPSIQEAINAASAGDTVIVRDGVWTGANNRGISFGGKNITVKSENGTAGCIIDCEGADRAFIFDSGEGATAVLRGFTIRNGSVSGEGGGIYVLNSGPTFQDLRIVLCTSTSFGGGIMLIDSTSELLAVSISGCTSQAGGAIAINGGSVDIFSIDISGCEANRAGGIDAFGVRDLTITGGGIVDCTARTSSGGGIYNYQTTLTVSDVEFANNNCTNFGGSIFAEQDTNLTVNDCSFNGDRADVGGGIYSGPGCTTEVNGCNFTNETADRIGGGCVGDNTDLTLTDCVFNDCHAGQSGGGCAISSGSTATLDDCTVSECDAPVGAGLYFFNCASMDVNDCTVVDNVSTGNAAGVYCELTDANFTNCLFEGNISGGVGGASLFVSCSPTLTNCTMANNSAPAGAGGAMFSHDCTTLVTNGIMWNNTPNEITNSGTTVTTVNYCNVQGGYAGTGNLNTNPMFVNMGAGDLHLSPASPCIDSGDTTAVPAGVIFDLDGNPRFVDRTGTPNTGNGSPPVDMGCFEVQLDRTQFLPVTFTISRGVHTGGVLSDLFSSDDSKVSVKAGLTLTQYESPLQVIVTTTSTIANPVELGFTLEASVNTSGLMQTLELFNYDTGLYEEVDFWTGSATDTIVEVLIDTNPERFVDNGTLEMKARIVYTQVGLTLLWPWSAFIDQTVWTIGH